MESSRKESGIWKPFSCGKSNRMLKKRQSQKSKRIGDLFPQINFKKEHKKQNRKTKAMEPFSCGNRMQKQKNKKAKYKQRKSGEEEALTLPGYSVTAGRHGGIDLFLIRNVLKSFVLIER